MLKEYKPTFWYGSLCQSLDRGRELMNERSLDSDERRLTPIWCTSLSFISVANLPLLIPKVLSSSEILPLFSISVVFFLQLSVFFSFSSLLMCVHNGTLFLTWSDSCIFVAPFSSAWSGCRSDPASQSIVGGSPDWNSQSGNPLSLPVGLVALQHSFLSWPHLRLHVWSFHVSVSISLIFSSFSLILILFFLNFYALALCELTVFVYLSIYIYIPWPFPPV